MAIILGPCDEVVAKYDVKQPSLKNLQCMFSVVSIGRLTPFYVVLVPMELICRYLWFCKISKLKSGTFLLSTKRNNDVIAMGGSWKSFFLQYSDSNIFCPSVIVVYFDQRWSKYVFLMFLKAKS